MMQILNKSKGFYFTFTIALVLSLFVMSSSVSAATYTSTDKEVYQKGETIYISGNSDTYPPGAQLKLEVIKGDPYLGEYVTETVVYTDANGDFEGSIKTDSSWDTSNDYIIKIWFYPTGDFLNVSNTFTVQ
ncbi:hypothetical protein [Virgibacillus ndiopensis]|uniref:hypothetical protein n=1 Tax=Virgibacillus ndiopensis TaxID=2004408 RepID=UPI000C06BB38|nr:hypothetical protein [Virgibacillus ndiopensis]